MVPADSHKVSRAPRYSGYCYQYCYYTRTGLSPSTVLHFPVASSSVTHRISQSYNPDIAKTTSVWALPISLATTLGITIVFSSSGYLDVSVHRVCLPYGILYLQYSGLPHSDTCGSYRMCQSPQLFAAYHVLLRL